MGRLGVNRFILSRVLNHTDSSVDGIYDRHDYLSQKRRALDLWAAELHRSFSGEEPQVAVKQFAPDIRTPG
jgi:hypothetical protein